MKIICIGRNYAAHAEELNHLIRGGAEDPAERSRQAGDGTEYPSGLRQIGNATECTAELPRLDGGNTGCTAEPSPQAGGGADTLPERNRPGCGECSPEPIWFLKPDTALLRNNDPFYIPAFSQEVHYECELVVRIDRVGKSIAERFAHRYYKEVGLGIDFTARDLQRQAAAEGLPWERSKAFDRSAAISPEFVSLQELDGDVQKLHFTLEVNRPDPPDGRHAADALYGGPHHRRRIAVHDPAHGRFDLHRHAGRRGTGQPRRQPAGRARRARTAEFRHTLTARRQTPHR